MAILNIRTFGDPVLRERARAVEKVTPSHRRLIDDMLDTMREAPGVGLAGPQVGVLERIFVWEVEDEWGAVINPVTTFASEETMEGEEGCLSLPGLAYPVVRPRRVVIEGLDADGEALRLEGEDLKARVFQHEIDHLDGVLFIDRLPEDLAGAARGKLSDLALGLTPVPSVPPEEVF